MTISTDKICFFKGGVGNFADAAFKIVQALQFLIAAKTGDKQCNAYLFLLKSSPFISMLTPCFLSFNRDRILSP